MEFPQQILDFLKEPYPMVLSTVSPNGRPQSTIVWFEYADGVFKISTTKDRLKYKNVLKNPRVSFVIYNPENSFNCLQAQGMVMDITDDGNNEFKKRMIARYTKVDSPAAYADRQEQRVIISITPGRHIWIAKTRIK